MRDVSRRSLLAAGAAGAAAGSVALSGCGTAKGDDGPLRFWNFYGPQNSPDPAVQAQSDWFVAMVDEWNKTHKTQIELTYIPQPIYLNGAKLPTAFAAGTGPDIFMVSPGDFLRYANGGILKDLTDHLKPEVIEDFGDSLESRTIDGRVYALPMEIEPLAIFYDVKAWERAGLSEGDIPTTWDATLDAGDKLRSPTRAGLVFETKPGYYQNFTWYPFMWQGGGEVLDKEGNSAFDSKAARQALGLWQDAVRHGIAPTTPPAANDVISGFKAGNVGMWQQGIWQVASFNSYAPDFEYGVFKLPVPSGGSYTTGLGGWTFGANTQGRDPDGAAEFIAWAIGSMEKHSIQRMTDWCVKAKTDIAPRRTALELGIEQGGYDSPVMKKFKDEIYPAGRAEPRYPPAVYKAISDAIQGTMLGGDGVSGAVDRADQSIEAYLKSYKGADLV
ncbi:ABC transporter substrate-binding protein [Streptomyces oceani]|uniref:Sugar ABC transporter substrate-binding protein n=1 Tax=Streptomyces oceani TaxID=1075402 RepID=A0A1E7KLZ5_9ACTN|nr:sugar ABC transporter substrate-binding protein [Streptomyces oceani]OEV04943.1 sugar ABC transporter substrate-binding protein [Streptomyces oceani]